MRDEKLQRYLAEHYYSGPKSEAVLARYGDGKKKKKKKRSHADAPSVADAMTIRDPSSVWFGTPEDEADEGEMDEAPVPAAPIHSETAPPASKSQKAGWTSVRAPTEPEAPPSAAAPPAAPAPDVPAPTTKPKAGLMTREQLKAQREAREAAERAAAEAEAQASAEPAPPPTETVYRDAQGRRINLEEEEARLKEEARQRALMEKERAQWNRGLVQRRAEAEQRAELATAEGERVTKYVVRLTPGMQTMLAGTNRYGNRSIGTTQRVPFSVSVPVDV